jgi:hypothetical protein
VNAAQHKGKDAAQERKDPMNSLDPALMIALDRGLSLLAREVRPADDGPAAPKPPRPHFRLTRAEAKRARRTAPRLT